MSNEIEFIDEKGRIIDSISKAEGLVLASAVVSPHGSMQYRALMRNKRFYDPYGHGVANPSRKVILDQYKLTIVPEKVYARYKEYLSGETRGNKRIIIVLERDLV